MKKQELVYIEKQKAFTDSLVISEQCPNQKKGRECKREHKETIALIRKYQTSFEQLGTFAFQTRKSGGIETTFAELNEDQATFLITLFKNTEKVVLFKLKLVKEFRKAFNELARIKNQHTDPLWLENRTNSKLDRRTLTDVVQSLEALADQQGGVKLNKEGDKNLGRHYYSSITKMIYKQLFGDGTLKNLRDKLDILQLQFLSICEQACADEIQGLVEIGLDYHTIYEECRKRVIATVQGLSASKLTGKGNLVKLAWDSQ